MIYDYKCDMCGHVKEFVVRSADRDNPRECPYCEQKVMQRQFPVEAIKQLQIWEPHYNECFDCDVNTRQEWQAILKDKGAEEAGDRVRGGRNFDEKANNILPQAPKGKTYVPESVRRIEDAKFRAQRDKEYQVQVEKNGQWKDL